MKILYTYSLILLVFLICEPSETNAQRSRIGKPYSFSLEEKAAQIIPVLELDSVNRQELLHDDHDFKIDNRYGVVQSCNIDIKSAGIELEIPGKGTIWRYQLESKNALSLGLNFKTYKLPAGASVYIYDASKANVHGSFTDENNSIANQLTLADFSGKNAVIEYFEPENASFSGELVLGAVSQAYLDIQSIAVDRIGINCTQGQNYQEEKTAICLMTYNDSRYSYYCTGALVNNVRQDEMPYFLTANHCISTSSEAATLVTYFNYENSTCSSSDASKLQTLSGATFKAGSSYSDFSLLLLNEYPPEEYNPFYAGWDASGTSPTSGVCIHHPEGTAKCISLENNQITSYPQSIQWSDDSGRTISTTTANTHWLVEFEEGSTEGGSSGGPLLDQNKRIVGQLHGGSTTESFFGKFSLSWNYSSTTTKQLAHWLDPDNTGTKILDGLGKRAPVAAFGVESKYVCVNNTVELYDESKYNPTAWSWQISPATYQYVNGTNSTSENPQVVFLADGQYSITLKTSNNYGGAEVSKQNLILAKSKLNVEFVQAKADTVVCGCNLDRFPFVASGALNYSFKISDSSLLSTEMANDTLFLSLTEAANGASSFDTWVKVVGSFGTCSASDSVLLHVIIQSNDNIANATKLSLGRNSGYSNRCATVETSEPSPLSQGCYTENSWCPDATNSSTNLNNSVWFNFVAPASGLLTIRTTGFDDQIAVYEATSYANILSGNSSKYTLVAANDNNSTSDSEALIENLVLDPEKEYWLQVDGNNAAYGDFTIDLLSNSLEVYPNPSTGVFNVLISNLFPGRAEVNIYDLKGKQIFNDQFIVSIESNKFTIDLSGVSNGVYLLNVVLNGSKLSRKLVVL